MRAIVPGTFFSLLAALAGQDPATSAPQSQPAPAIDPHVVVPISQITRLHGTMANTLSGVGLVTGLAGTGSSDKASRQMMANYLKEMAEVNINDSDLTTGSWAMVNVTAQLPAFAKAGMQLDLRVATIGDASSLYGGTLMTTLLRGVDGVVYATGDGSLSVAGSALVVHRYSTRSVPPSGSVASTHRSQPSKSAPSWRKVVVPYGVVNPATKSPAP